MGKIHKRDIRLYNNAGMSFPTCCANAKLLDLAKGYWWLTDHNELVTCKRCLKKMAKGERC